MTEDAWLREQARAFGRRVRYARNARGWTQADLAQATGEPYMSAPAISRLENGRGDPLQSTVLRLAQTFGLEPHALYGSDEAVASLPLLTPTLAELLRVFARLPEALQRHALAFLTELERQGLSRGEETPADSPPDRSDIPNPPA